jgi:L-alanine-DL-glutamate epimerase-like enolase superfamily enzyme
MEFRITDIETVTVDVPFTEVAGRNMRRASLAWSVSEVVRVKTNVGLEGVGETIVNYTWSRGSDEKRREAVGRNPFELLYRDDLGAGLQIAIWDLAAQHAGVPVHALIGDRVREAAPIAWWCIDMPPTDWADEARRAVAAGYTTFKLKGRPWWDIVEQVEAVVAAVGPDVLIDLDFNELLLNADNALDVCRRLEAIPSVAIFESPIPQGDIKGNQRLRAELRSEIAHHMGNPPVPTAAREGVCDGFVVCAGAAQLTRQAHAAQELAMPFWIQLVGTGITTTWASHLGVALQNATWPAITCMNIYSEQLISQPIEVVDGHIAVSDEVGLGLQLDEDAIERLRVDPEAHVETPRVIYTAVFADGQQAHYRDEDAYRQDFKAGNMPIAHRDVRMDTWRDDGSDAFAELLARVAAGPVREAAQEDG